MLQSVRGFFSTPGRQAAGWAALGVVGLAFALGGILLVLADGDGGGGRAAHGDIASPPSATAPATPAGTAAASPTPTAAFATAAATASETPTLAPTAAPAATRATTGGQAPQAPPEPTATPVPSPTPAPAVVAGGPYCPTISATAPPSSIFGTLTIAGAPAPAGTLVTLAFDGVAGPSRATAEAGGYRVDWAAGGDDCANRVGAAIAVIVDGQAFATGRTVGGGSPALRFDVAVP